MTFVNINDHKSGVGNDARLIFTPPSSMTASVDISYYKYFQSAPKTGDYSLLIEPFPFTESQAQVGQPVFGEYTFFDEIDAGYLIDWFTMQITQDRLTSYSSMATQQMTDC